ncbi:MAG: hypothetical protein P8X82_18890 [Gemmatimonadales bacterium]
MSESRSVGTPPSDLKFTPDTLKPRKNCPRPNVRDCSAKMGPVVLVLRTGTPPTNVNVAPLLVALSGVLDTLFPIAAVMNWIRARLPDATAGR